MENSSFGLKALNADDDCEVRELIRLFERAYGSFFPLAPVYQGKFWKSHAGTRFTSLGVWQGRKIVAHLAIRPDRDNPQHVQIYLPVCDADFTSAPVEIHQQLVEIVERQAERHAWELLYCFAVSDIQTMRFLADGLLGTQEVAIWPRCLPTASGETGAGVPYSETASYRRHITVTQKLIGSAGVNQSQAPGEDIPLYVPAWHQQICSWLYSTLGLTRIFYTSFEHAKVKQQFLPAFSADRRSVETRTYRHTKVSLSCIEPNLAGDFRQVLRQLAQVSGLYSFVSVNMRDPATPAFCLALEENGYRFCGVLPFHRGKESILYCNDAARLSSAEELGASPSPLARYIEKYNFNRESRSTWQIPANVRRFSPRAGAS